MTDTLHTKYRPTTFKDVIGQDHFLKELAGIVKERTAHAFLFHGPAGCGKTTLARICANQLGCSDIDLIEVDGATKNGVDHMRDLQQTVRYKPIGGGKVRAVILDEAHRVTGNAFDSILKIVEEPPSHLFWFFCTTNPSKVPNTVRTRCQQFAVRDVDPRTLQSLLGRVAGEEGIKLNDDVLAYIATKSQGSPRRALVNLERCAAAKSIKDAARSLEQVMDEDNVIELCRFMCQFEKKRPWTKAMELVGKVGEANPESIRIVMVNYIGACLKGAKSDADAVQYLSMLECFATPFPPSEAQPMLMLAIGKALLAE